jgi:N-acetylglucosaminyldiphosphoundecaprenol N-acetyl-beta-D-mannosaminyltransferase
MNRNDRIVANVLKSNIDAQSSYSEAVAQVVVWARERKSRYVALCNAHMAVTASRDEVYRTVINQADMATADGAPVAWLMRRQGFSRQSRISGTELVRALCEQCSAESIPVYFYGSTERTLATLVRRLQIEYPELIIAGFHAPPFRALTEEEDEAAIERMNASYAGLVFVGLGCPKQEWWMAEHRGRVNAVMLGVGAAFDFLAGTARRAPLWMQRGGLEWLHRLAMEPRRLWKRYLVTNTLFVLGAFRQIMFSGKQLARDDERQQERGA